MSKTSNRNIKILKTIANLNIYIGFSLIFITIVLFFLFSNIRIDEEKIFFNYVQRENEILSAKIFESENMFNQNEYILNFDIPKINIPSDNAILTENRIIIPRIGVDTNIYESLNVEKGLEKGVWRDYSQGRPDVPGGLPTILFAHRWGYDDYSYEYRSRNLFLNLPMLQKNDIIEIVWFGNKKIYKVESIEIRQFASRPDVDLILVTCRDYTSPLRYIVYANKI